MKYIVVISLILIFGCSDSMETPDSPKTSEDFVTRTDKPATDTLNNPDISDSLNYVDPNGLKQGKWITRGYKNKIIKIETFENDTLNGYWFNWDGMQEVGSYKGGKKNGFFRVHYEDRFSKNILQLKLYRDDSLLWSACPAADSRSAVPHKGFHTELDSIFIEAPHYNHSLWYKGLFLHASPVGKHYIYDINERLLATTNYTDSTVLFTEHASKEFIDLTKMVAVQWKFN